jgi:hypothetical protein
MAIPCQGFTVSWGSLPLAEVQTLDINRDRGLPVGRVTTWTPSFGTIEIAGFSTANLPESEYGQRKRLKFEGRTATSGPVIQWFDRDCIFENARIQAIANDAVRFAFTFRIQDTVGAPTHP